MKRYQKKEEFERDIVSHQSNVVIAKERDEETWTNPTYEEDKQFKKDRSNSSSQHGINYILQTYLRNEPNMRLTIGRQRI